MPSIHHWSSSLFCLILMTGMLVGCGALAPVEQQPSEAVETQPTEEELQALQAQQDFEAGLNAMKSGNHQMAHDVFFAMTNAYPDYAGPWVNLGILYHRKGEDDKAEEVLRKALDINEDNPEVFNQLGVFYRDLGKFHTARDVYERGLSLHPDYAPLYRNVGILYDLYLNQGKLALQHYQAYIKLEPDDKQVETWIADLLQRLQ